MYVASPGHRHWCNQMQMQVITDEMREFMAKVRSKVVIGLVGGSDLVKIEEQMKGTGR